MTPNQQRLFDYLAERSPAVVGGYELRDAVSPRADVKTIHVTVCHMRAQGVQIQSKRGPRGGYCVAEAA